MDCMKLSGMKALVLRTCLLSYCQNSVKNQAFVAFNGDENMNLTAEQGQ